MADVDRGVSTALGYTLNLAIATVLVTGLLVAAGGYVEDQQQRAIRSELEVIGARIAGDVTAVDRLARSGTNPTVAVTVSTPVRTTGVPYRIAINRSGNERIVLSTTDPEVTVSVPYNTSKRVQPTTVSGGTFVLRYDGSPASITVEDTDG